MGLVKLMGGLGFVEGAVGKPPRPCGLLARRPPEGQAETARWPDFARLAVLHARRAWEDSGLAVDGTDREAVATVVATTNWGTGSFSHLLQGRPDTAASASVLMETPHAAADAISNELGLGGRKATFVNACAAGANAVAHGMDLLRSGRAEAVLVGGVNLLSCPELLASLGSWRSLDAAPCSPYTHSAGPNLGNTWHPSSWSPCTPPGAVEPADSVTSLGTARACDAGRCVRRVVQ